MQESGLEKKKGLGKAEGGCDGEDVEELKGWVKEKVKRKDHQKKSGGQNKG